MEIDFSFPPNAARARALDFRMHRELGLSLRHVRDSAADVLDFDRGRLDGVIDRLVGGGPVAPAMFARYYELVEAICRDDRAGAESLLVALGTARPAPCELEVVTLGDDALGVESDRYLRKMNADTSLDLGFLPPSAVIDQAFRTRLQGGLSILDRVLPELSGEIRGIVRQVVIAGSDPSKRFQFDGGSHYQLWGALFLNGSFHPDEIAVAEVLAHESAHSLLFGFCIEEALVENGDEELFTSPLRTDERPMDGIYHATFVSARMHWALRELADSALLTAEQRQRAREAIKADLENFDAGYGVVAQYGRLTATGQAIMASAKSYIDAAR